MKIIDKLYKLKKGNRIFINGKKYFVVLRDKTTIKEHIPLKEVLIALTDKRVISVDKNQYSVYKIIDFGLPFFKFRILWKITKKPKISF